MGDLMLPRDSPPPGVEQTSSGVLLPEKRSRGEFHSPQREPVQLLSFHHEPAIHGYGGGVGTYAPDPLPPDRMSIDDQDVDSVDAETPAVYQMSSEASSHYKKAELYDEIDKYEDKRRPAVKTRGGSGLHCFTLVVAMLALTIGTGGLAVALYHFLFESSSGCSCSDDRIATLEAQVLDAQAMIEALTQTVGDPTPGDNSADDSAARVDELETRVEEISRILAALVPETNKNTTLNGTSMSPPTSKNLSLYEDCTTGLAHQCSVALRFTGEHDFSVCETGTYSLSQPGYTILDVYCSIVTTSGQSDPIITSLSIDQDANTAKCLCYTAHLTSSAGNPVCGLYVTRCPATYHLEL